MQFIHDIHIHLKDDIDGLAQDCSNSIANTLELHKSCIKSWIYTYIQEYCKTSYISRTFVGNNIVDNSDVVGAAPVGAAPTTSSFST